MGRRRWTTDEQGTWLTGHLDAFIESQLAKTTAKDFFPKVIKEWHKAWPLPDPMQEELAAAKSPEDAIKKKTTKEDEVCQLSFVYALTGTDGVLSRSRHGFITIPEARHMAQVLEVF